MFENQKRAQVLVVEDDPALRESLAQLLETEWEVETADSIQAAWDYIEHHGPPQIILSDVTMPGGTGLELLEKVRADERTCLVPFILVSSII